MGPGTSDALITPTLERVYQDYGAYVAHSLLRLGIRPKDIEDRLHDVFVALHGQLHRYDPTRPLKPWLFAFVYRIAKNGLRKERRYNEDPKVDLERLGVEGADAEARSLVWQLLSNLPVNERAAIVMHELDGYTLDEMAAALSCHRSTAARTLRSAHLALNRLVNTQ